MNELGQASNNELPTSFMFLLSASTPIYSFYSAKRMGSSARTILFGGGGCLLLIYRMCDRLLLSCWTGNCLLLSCGAGNCLLLYCGADNCLLLY